MATKYESKYGGGLITGPQYVAEVMCSKKAAFDKIKLSNKFWQDIYWNKEFLKQLRAANTLHLIYSTEVILKAVNDREFGKSYSLHSPRLERLLEKHNITPQKASIEVKIDNTAPIKKKNNLRDKL